MGKEEGGWRGGLKKHSARGGLSVARTSLRLRTTTKILILIELQVQR